MSLKEKFKTMRAKIREVISKFLKLLQNEKVDNVEVKLIKTAISSGLSVKGYTISEKIAETIAEEIVEGLNKLNENTQARLDG